MEYGGMKMQEVKRSMIPQVRIGMNWKCGKRCIYCNPRGEAGVCPGNHEMSIAQIAAIAGALVDPRPAHAVPARLHRPKSNLVVVGFDRPGWEGVEGDQGVRRLQNKHLPLTQFPRPDVSRENCSSNLPGQVPCGEALHDR